jgi:hypothetical protein
MTATSAGPAPRVGPGPGARLAGVFLIALMAIGSVLMWIGFPFGWIWFASHLQRGTDPSLGPYVMVLFGLPLTMVVLGKILAALDRRYGRIMGQTPESRRRLPWMKSMRGERGSSHQRTVLDIVMIISVSIAGTAFGIWFFVFAGSSLPH